jgi:hypothetical protein
MSFELEETTYDMTFEDPALNGLKAEVREISTGDLLDLVDLLEEVKGKSGLAMAKPVKRLMEMVGDGLVTWNLAKGGEPVPASYEGLRRQPLKFTLAIAGAWAQVMGGIEAPLPNGSSGGETSLEPSIPMELSSPSPGS